MQNAGHRVRAGDERRPPRGHHHAVGHPAQGRRPERGPERRHLRPGDDGGPGVPPRRRRHRRRDQQDVGRRLPAHPAVAGRHADGRREHLRPSSHTSRRTWRSRPSALRSTQPRLLEHSRTTAVAGVLARLDAAAWALPPLRLHSTVAAGGSAVSDEKAWACSTGLMPGPVYSTAFAMVSSSGGGPETSIVVRRSPATSPGRRGSSRPDRSATCLRPSSSGSRPSLRASCR